MNNTAQMRLFDLSSSKPDVVMPDDYRQHYLETGTCMNCHFDLNHTMHAFNHYRKFHAPKPPKPRFFVLRAAAKGKVAWQEVTYKKFLYAKSMNRPTARTKTMN